MIDLIVDGEVITTTEDDPFWSVIDQQFECVDELEAGEKALRADGRIVRVLGFDVSRRSHRRASSLNGGVDVTALAMGAGFVALSAWGTIVALLWSRLPRRIRWRIAGAFSACPIATFVISAWSGFDVGGALAVAGALGLLLLMSSLGHPELIVDQTYIYGNDPVPADVADRSTRSQWAFVVAFHLVGAAVGVAVWPRL